MSQSSPKTDDANTGVHPSAPRTDRTNNHDTQGCWEAFSGHRQVVTELLMQAAAQIKRTGAEEFPSLCILGAGNVNDVELQTLAETFGSIDLVDIDKAAVEAGVSRQARMVEPSSSQKEFLSQMHLAEARDVSGIAHLLPEVADGPLERDACERLADQLLRQMASYTPLSQSTGPQTYDIVVSTCMLSQLVRQNNDALGENTKKSDAVAHQTIINHLEYLVALTAPNGISILITDCASTSKGMPELASIFAPDEIQAAAQQAFGEGRYYRQMAGKDLLTRAQNASLQPYLSSIELSPYWKWTISNQQQYLCYAVSLNRSTTPLGSTSSTAEDALASKLRAFTASTGVATRSVGLDLE